MYRECQKSETGKILLDKNLIIISANKNGANLIGFERQNIIGINFLVLVNYSFRKTISLKLQRMFGQRHTQNTYKTLLNFLVFRTKRIKVILKNISKKREKSFTDNNFIVSIEKNNKENLCVSTRLINNLSHELRSPICNIQSFLETLYEYDKKLTCEQRLEFIEIAVNETNRLNKLINNLLDFSVMRNKKFPYDESLKFSLQNIINETLQLNRIQAIKKKILLIRTININKIEVNSNNDSTLRVLLNLLNNSIKFTYPNGIINIKIKIVQSVSIIKKHKKSAFKLSVTDTGIGISKKDISVVFNRFSRVNKRKNTIAGSGLGLAIIKDILAEENQYLRLSTSLGKGTITSFNLFDKRDR